MALCGMSQGTVAPLGTFSWKLQLVGLLQKDLPPVYFLPDLFDPLLRILKFWAWFMIVGPGESARGAEVFLHLTFELAPA